MKITTLKDNMFDLTTSRYKIIHTIKAPTRITDYDYGDGKRYISTYIHTLEFRDKFTESKICEFSFPSDVCAKIISTLYKMVILDDYMIPFIIVPGNPKIGLHFWHTPGNILRITITEKESVIAVFQFDGEEEIKGLIGILDVDEIEEMFISSSE